MLTGHLGISTSDERQYVDLPHDALGAANITSIMVARSIPRTSVLAT